MYFYSFQGQFFGNLSTTRGLLSHLQQVNLRRHKLPLNVAVALGRVSVCAYQSHFGWLAGLPTHICERKCCQELLVTHQIALSHRTAE